MDRWLATLPRKFIALGSIAIGIVFIILLNPPHTVCDSQKEIFKKDQTGFIFLNKKQKGIKTTGVRRLIDACKLSPEPGGCYELFGQLRRLRKDLRRIGGECSRPIANISQVKKAVIESAELMVKLAWGSKPPRQIVAKYGWLDPADMNLFCGLKSIIIDYYGKNTWDTQREKWMAELPGNDQLTREQVWSRSIISDNCVKFQ